MLVGDGFCNDITNTPECYYDGGDCCGNHNNGWVPNIVDCKFCECKAPYGFVYNRQKVKTLFGRNTCFSSLSSIGDGFCEDRFNTPHCNFDGGDCCGSNVNLYFCEECQCIGTSSEDFEFRDYAGESFQQLIKECIEIDRNVDLINIFKALGYPRKDVIDGILLLDEEQNITSRNETKDQAWTSGFHLEFGYCHTFDLRRIPRFSWLPSHLSFSIMFKIKKRDMLGFLHKEKETPNFHNTKVEASFGATIPNNPLFGHQIIHNVYMSKRHITLPQDQLQRLPCSKEPHYSCIHNSIQDMLEKTYGCKIPVLSNGYQLLNYTYKKLPDCSNNITFEVSHFWSAFKIPSWDYNFICRIEIVASKMYFLNFCYGIL